MSGLVERLRGGCEYEADAHWVVDQNATNALLEEAASRIEALEGEGWQPIESIARDGRWIVVVDTWGNATTMRWDATEIRDGERSYGERGWVGKSGFTPPVVPESGVAWSYAPHCPRLAARSLSQSEEESR